MKVRTLLVLAMLLIPLLHAACSRPPVGALLLWDCNSFDNQPHISQQQSVAPGETVTVMLCSHGTDFKWSESAQISDQNVVKQVKDDFSSLEKSGLMNLMKGYPKPGDLVWTFETLKEGTSTITLDYSQPGEGGEKGKWTYDLTVIVE